MRRFVSLWSFSSEPNSRCGCCCAAAEKYRMNCSGSLGSRIGVAMGATDAFKEVDMDCLFSKHEKAVVV